MKKRLVTAALPYVNNIPHLGNLLQVLSGDMFARHCRSMGYETLYICGTDEYGTATETRALEQKVSPKELCDHYNAIHQEVYRWFGIDFDKFGRTSDSIQTEIVQGIFKDIWSMDFFNERETEQLYCLSCTRYLADRYVEGICPHCDYTEARGDQCDACGKLLDPTELEKPRCSVCASTPELRKTKHLYLDLPALLPQLEAWVDEASTRGKWAKNALMLTKSWLRDGLKERCITRDLSWGIPVPVEGFEGKVFYVWFDAPMGYISITAGHTEDWKSWWQNPDNVELFQFIGKDNIPFHTVIFPACLIASELATGKTWTKLHHMSSTEYLQYEGGKFSKSRGVGIFGDDAAKTGIPADYWRFYLAYIRPEKTDISFQWADFMEKINGELIGNIGNLFNRSLSFIQRFYPDFDMQGEIDPEIIAVADAGVERVVELMEGANLRDGLQAICALSSEGNKFFQQAEPWKTKTDDPEGTQRLLRSLVYVLERLAILLEPYIPNKAQEMKAALGIEAGLADILDLADESCECGDACDCGDDCTCTEDSCEDMAPCACGDACTCGDACACGDACTCAFLELEPCHLPAFAGKLFEPLDPKRIEELSQLYGEKEEGNTMEIAEGKDLESMTEAEKASYAFSQNVDLRVGQIVEIEKHPEADKLYVLKIDLAEEEPRQIVSGLVGWYEKEELLNQKVIVVTNLKASKLRGIKSNGMILAAAKTNAEGVDEALEVLMCPEAQNGCLVRLEGIKALDEYTTIKAPVFFDIPIELKDYQVSVGGLALMAGATPVKTTKLSDGSVG